MMAEGIEFVGITCAECGVRFAIGKGNLSLAQRFERTIYCPNGHENAFKSEEQEVDEAALKSALDEARREIAALKEQNIEMRSRLEQAEARAAQNPAAIQKRKGAA